MSMVRNIMATGVPILALVGPLATCSVLSGPQETAQVEALVKTGATAYQIACIQAGRLGQRGASDSACIQALNRTVSP